jgi:hypothetical protein
MIRTYMRYYGSPLDLAGQDGAPENFWQYIKERRGFDLVLQYNPPRGNVEGRDQFVMDVARCFGSRI